MELSWRMTKKRPVFGWNHAAKAATKPSQFPPGPLAMLKGRMGPEPLGLLEASTVAFVRTCFVRRNSGL